MNENYKNFLNAQEKLLELRRDEIDSFKHYNMWEKYHELLYFIKKLNVYSDLKYDYAKEETKEYFYTLEYSKTLIRGYMTYLSKVQFFRNPIIKFFTKKEFNKKYYRYLKYYQCVCYLHECIFFLLLDAGVTL